MNKGLIIFAREPVPGKVKTRLASDLGVADATRLYAAMLADVLECAASLADVRILVFWAQEEGDVPQYPELSRLEMCRQVGETLGDRMSAAFSEAFARGIGNCCIIGSDSPNLPIEYIISAFAVLEQDLADVVFGPADDGGYYLLGMNRIWERLFEDITWSSPQVLAVSRERAAALNLRATLLPGWYDLDTVDDLRRLAGSVGRSAPHTREVLRYIMPEIPSATTEGCA